MIIAEHMRKKMERALKHANDCYDLDDIENALMQGKMQGHVIGNTWALTQVHDFPQKRSIEITFVVGDLLESIEMEKYLTDWARAMGANMITAVGRDGWWERRTEGWRKVGTLYAKDI